MKADKPPYKKSSSSILGKRTTSTKIPDNHRGEVKPSYPGAKPPKKD